MLKKIFLDKIKFLEIKMAQETVVAVSNEVYANQVKLFGKWNCDEVNVEDISLRVSKYYYLKF
jgi:hypothetical protein